MPFRKNSGKKTMTMMSPENATPGATSSAAARMSAFGFPRIRRRKISVKMIALSTMSPTATARPPSVMMLTPRPRCGKRRSPAPMLTGIVRSTMRSARKLISVRPSTTTTISAASRTMLRPLEMERLMKSDCR